MPNTKRLVITICLAIAFGVLMLAEEAIELFGVHVSEDLVIFEALEIAVLIGLVIAILLATWDGYQMWQRQKTLEFKVSRASNAFQDMIEAHFENWGFTDAERDVTRLILKGCSIAEISEIRDAKQGTVKAQLNAVYKKSGYGGKSQLLSALLEELSDGASVS